MQAAAPLAFHLRTQVAPRYDATYHAILECPAGKEIARLSRPFSDFFTYQGVYSEHHFAAALRESLCKAAQEALAAGNKGSGKGSKGGKPPAAAAGAK